MSSPSANRVLFGVPEEGLHPYSVEPFAYQDGPFSPYSLSNQGYSGIDDHASVSNVNPKLYSIPKNTKSIARCRQEDWNADEFQYRVRVTNLPLSFSDEQLKSLFCTFGDIAKCHIVCDSLTRRSKGYGFVSFSHHEDAQRAVFERDGYTVNGRRITVRLEGQ